MGTDARAPDSCLWILSRPAGIDNDNSKRGENLQETNSARQIPLKHRGTFVWVLAQDRRQ
jgi:hypothetical protein